MSEVRIEPATTDLWPVLTLSKWEDTRDALHLWSQVVGKVRLALEPRSTTGGRCRCTSRRAV